MTASSAGKPLGRFVIAVYVLLTLLLFKLPHIALASLKDVNMQEFMSETQKTYQEEKNVTMIWWIPVEYWTIMNEKAGTFTEAAMKEIVKFYDDYLIVVVVKGTVSAFGGATYEPEEAIRKNIRLIDSKDTRYAPFEKSNIKPDALNFMATMKPIFANTLGPLGQNMHVFLFPSHDGKGKKIVKAGEEGNFIIQVGKDDFKWKLPLGSILPPKICPVDKEKLNGAWKYCPWHGVKLK